ncbi:MAG: hydrogenase/urease accessory protein HupE [Oceanicoccus sp.]|jgi:hydrogenase/urease accessory protein HupE
MRYLPLFVSLLFYIVASSPLSADDLRPASLTIKALDNSNYEISWLVPTKNGVRPPLSVAFDSKPMLLTPKRVQQNNNISRQYWRIHQKIGLAGSTVSIVGLKGSTYDVLLRIIDQQQQTITTVLNTEKPTYTVPDINTIDPEDTVITYIILGVEHILIGLDHLLFVACLVYISGSRKKLLLTITGFTVAHSITLILAATGILTVPIPPVEAVIALSIMFLACEIAKNNKYSLSLRYPVLVSSSFGLLHGFGFASVLADIGLPETEKILALLCFNIGVEIGQLLFVAALFIGFYVLSKLYKPLTKESLRFPASYFCGSLASIWMLERLAAF